MPKSIQLIVPQTYAALRRRVEDALLKGQRLIEEAKVRTYHETGRLINEHILLNRTRADYGGRVIEQLANDLAIDKRLLYACAQFARLFPIVIARSHFTWAHYRSLCQIEDPAQRIGRPRQVYTGAPQRNYVPMDQRAG